MASSVPSRTGQINGAGVTDALFLKVWSGEVINAFATATIYNENQITRTIASGKSAQFPASWKTTAAFHVPGAEILGNVINHNERIILIDDLLISPVFLDALDEAKNHVDYRGEYSRQTGRALARQMDSNIAQVSSLAARATATVTGGFGGTELINAAAAATPSALAAELFNSAQALDEKDVPSEDRVAYLRPAQYWPLINSGLDVINKDFDGVGSVSQGTLVRVAGLRIRTTNQMPSTNVVAGPPAYQGDFSNTVAQVTHRSAVGTVKLLDLATEMEYDIRRQGTLIVSKYAMGHGILRPESAVEIRTA